MMSRIARSAQVPSLDRYVETYRRSLVDPERYWLDLARAAVVGDAAVSGAARQLVISSIHLVCGRELERDGSMCGSPRRDAAQQTAIIWAKDEAGDYEYAELHRRVGRMANVLRSQGVQRGIASVCICHGAEVTVAMLGNARIGAVHSIVFAGFQPPP